MELDPPQNIVDLRAHHLISLASLQLFGAHKYPIMEKYCKERRSKRMSAMGYEDAEKFNDHIMDIMIRIIRGEIENVRIISQQDIVCEKCPQRRDDHCKVLGRKFRAEAVSVADEAIAKNSKGLIEIGEIYPSEYLTKNTLGIMGALAKTALQLPRLSRLASGGLEK